MIKPLNQLNAIFDEILKRRLSGSEQLILLHLYNAFNRSHWTESIQLSDESLLALLNQYDSNGKPASIETIRRAKQKLKNKRLIDFEPGKGNQITTYRLVKFYPDDTPDYTPADTPDNTPDDTLYNNNSISVAKNKIRQEDVEDGASASNANTADYFISAKVRNCWIQNAGMNPFGETAKTLSELEKTHGTELVTVAIKAANRNGDGTINMPFLESTLEKVLAGTIKYEIDEKGEVKFLRNVKGERKSGKRNDNNAWDD